MAIYLNLDTGELFFPLPASVPVTTFYLLGSDGSYILTTDGSRIILS